MDGSLKSTYLGEHLDQHTQTWWACGAGGVLSPLHSASGLSGLSRQLTQPDGRLLLRPIKAWHLGHPHTPHILMFIAEKCLLLHVSSCMYASSLTCTTEMYPTPRPPRAFSIIEYMLTGGYVWQLAVTPSPMFIVPSCRHMAKMFSIKAPIK